MTELEEHVREDEAFLKKKTEAYETSKLWVGTLQRQMQHLIEMKEERSIIQIEMNHYQDKLEAIQKDKLNRAE